MRYSIIISVWGCSKKFIARSWQSSDTKSHYMHENTTVIIRTSLCRQRKQQWWTGVKLQILLMVLYRCWIYLNIVYNKWWFFFIHPIEEIFSFSERWNVPFNSAPPHWKEHYIFRLMKTFIIWYNILPMIYFAIDL